jgi:hypothetical protein
VHALLDEVVGGLGAGFAGEEFLLSDIVALLVLLLLIVSGSRLDTLGRTVA